MSRGDVVLAHASLDRVAPNVDVKTSKCEGHIRDLFTHVLDRWLRVGEVQKVLQLQHCEVVSRQTVRESLKALVLKGWLEVMEGHAGPNAPHRYRRLLSDERREAMRAQNARAAALQAGRKQRVVSMQGKVQKRNEKRPVQRYVNDGVLLTFK